VDTYEYDAFGNEVNHTGTTPNNYLYRGEQYDPDLSLYYLRARYMNPLTGRFLSRDPEEGDAADPESLHKYLYANADPVNQSDPTGESTVAEEEEVTSLVDLAQAGPRYPAGLAIGAAAGGTGLYGLGYLILCTYYAEGAGASHVIGPDGMIRIIRLSIPGCTALYNLTGPGPGPGPGPREPPPPPKNCPQQHPNWPINFVYASYTPTIAMHIRAAQAAGSPDALTYLGPNSPQQTANRNAACPPGKYAGSGMTCDEYPYASTVEGGAGASTAPAPAGEQSKQGSTLRWFYAGLKAGQQFCVVVIL